jgi:hypothetical protein
VVGLLHGENVFGLCIGLCNRRLYIIATILTNGRYEYTEVPVGARPEQNAQENVYGCGILIDPDNKLTTFFTLNGILLGEFYLVVCSKSISDKKITRKFILYNQSIHIN